MKHGGRWRPFEDRIERDPETGCWLWTGRVNGSGYARVYWHPVRREQSVHRILYEQEHGPIPNGLDLDHLCRVKRCVNPAHVEPVTRSENLKRGIGVGSAGLAAMWKANARKHAARLKT